MLWQDKSKALSDKIINIAFVSLMHMKTKTHLVPVLTQLLRRTSLSVLVGIGIASCLLPQPSLAQLDKNPADPKDQFNDQQNNDPFSSRSQNNGLNPLDLMHRAQLGTLRNPDQFDSDQRDNLNDAAAQFHRQQLQRLRQPNQSAPVQPENTTPNKN